MFRLMVFIVSLVWASLLLFSWSGAESPQTAVPQATAGEQQPF